MTTKQSLVALLRGINVGGHHKVPMADLKKMLQSTGLENVRTLLNSGNVVFETTASQHIEGLQDHIETHLSQAFGFPIPVILKEKNILADLLAQDPFNGIVVHKDIRLYISFLKNDPAIQLNTPWLSKDGTYQILSVENKMICSVLDLSTTQTPKGMDELEKLFGKDITTRNLNTIQKIVDL